MVTVASIGGDIHLIDANALGIKGYCSSYVVSSGREHVLIETGPSTSSDALLAGISQLGYDLDSFTNVVVTHIHFDHAGGLGNLIDRMPNALAVVHERGAKHVIDPSKLTESARRVFGDSLSLYGEFKAVDEKRVRSVDDGDAIDFQNGRRLRVLYAPGHASHEICIFDEKTASLFTGDAAGLYFEDSDEVVPTTPPPDFDLDVAISTIDRLARLEPRRLLFSHFGLASQSQAILAEAKRQLTTWGQRILQIFTGGYGTEQERLKRLSSVLQIRTRVMPTALKYEHRSSSVNGYLRYFRKRGDLAPR